ncbi:MAG: sulfur carrier protein ThiS [Bacteroides sp.]
MKVMVNNQEVETSYSVLQEFIQSLDVSIDGIAVAVNNRLVQRVHWDTFILQENDNIVIIKAACGG